MGNTCIPVVELSNLSHMIVVQNILHFEFALAKTAVSLEVTLGKSQKNNKQ